MKIFNPIASSGTKCVPIVYCLNCVQLTITLQKNECRERNSLHSCHLDSRNSVIEHISLINNILSANVPDSESLWMLMWKLIINEEKSIHACTQNDNTVDILKYQMLVACEKGIDKQCRPRSRSSLFRVLPLLLWQAFYEFQPWSQTVY